MLLTENPRSHSGIGVVVEHRHGPLHDDRSAVECLGHEVHGGTSNLYAVLQRLTLGIQSRKRRKERGMDIQNGLRKRLEERCADQSHVPSQTHETNVTSAQLSYDRPLVVIARRRRSMIDIECLDAGAPGYLEAGGVRTIGNHDGDDGIQLPVADGVN